MDKSPKNILSLRKETKRRSRYSSSPSELSAHSSRPSEGEGKSRKHQISFLLNQTAASPSRSEPVKHDTRQVFEATGSTTSTVGNPNRYSPTVSSPESWLDNTPAKKPSHDPVRRSSAERRRTCDVCGKKFAQPADLKKHVNCVHLKQRPFQCDECDAAFGEKGNLNRHKKSVHEKERPWVCAQCGLPFAFRDTLNRHVRAVHQDIRPFPCPYCRSAFKKRDHLIRHQEALHGIQKR